jgi:phthiodiolone/phenolphthiodiolone dimycocerosates ketoreductase
MSKLSTSIMLWGDRHFPSSSLPEQARALAASGAVDELTLPDHLVNLIPPSLWTTDNTPMAAVLRDVDSLHDTFVMGALARAAAPELGLTFVTDAIRRGPAEICQTMLTYAAITGGRARFMFGAGEAKQCRSYGHKRSQGLARQEDLLRIFDALWKADGPIDHDGNHSVMKQAFLGAAKTHRPEVWALGTGPKQLDLATSLCDGVGSLAPFAWPTPERAAAEIAAIKATLERKGRDPDAFGFGLHVAAIIHDDPDVLDRALDNPIVRWTAAIFGRINPGDWRAEGIEPATPEGWNYYMHYAPYLTPQAFIDEVLVRASREMAEKAFIVGDARSVAACVQEYVDAGVNWIGMNDLSPLLGGPEDAAGSLGRMIEVCASLKSASIAGVS